MTNDELTAHLSTLRAYETRLDDAATFDDAVSVVNAAHADPAVTESIHCILMERLMVLWP